METVIEKKPLQLLELERELSAPDGEVAMKKHDAVLASLGERVASALSRGVAPEEFDRVQKLQESVIFARKLLRLTARKERVSSPAANQ